MIKKYQSRSRILSAIALLFFFGALSVSAQSGGGFAITQSVIAAGGGQNATGGNFSLDATIGQSLAGDNSTGGAFAVRGGFWLPTLLAPTAAAAGVSGRVITAQGFGIRSVIVTLTDSSGTVRTTRTGMFGYFKFDEVTVGETYIFTVSAKRYTFSQPTIVRSVLDEIADLDFIADAQ